MPTNYFEQFFWGTKNYFDKWMKIAYFAFSFKNNTLKVSSHGFSTYCFWISCFPSFAYRSRIVERLDEKFTNYNEIAAYRDFRCFCHFLKEWIHAEVVTTVAGSLEAGGLPRYPESLFVEIKVMKSWQSS